MKIDIIVPSVGESVREGMVHRWLKQDGEQVKTDEVLVELETDKATVEVVAENNGVLNIIKQAGATVTIGEALGTIDDSASPSAAPKKSDKKTTPKTPSKTAEEPAVPPPQDTTSADASTAHAKLSPAVRRIVAEQRLDPAQLQGTGKDGRLLKQDALAATTQASTPTPEPVAAGGERRVPMSMLRRRIAERLVAAQNETAMLTTFNEINLSTVIACRQRYKDAFMRKHNINLGFMGFFCLACTQALQEFPELNAFVDGNDVIYHDYVNMGIAVSTPRGLVVPVIKNIETLPLHVIEAQITAFAAKAREGKISVDDMQGGTFTISNGGVFGSLLSTPILNPPQSGILGMHKISKRPIVDATEQITVAPMMYVALSYDHRIADGKQAVGFLVRVKDLLEDPTRFLLEV